MISCVFLVLVVLCGGCVLVGYLSCGVGLVFRLGVLLLYDDGTSSLVYQLGDEILSRCLDIGRWYWRKAECLHRKKRYGGGLAMGGHQMLGGAVYRGGGDGGGVLL